MTPTAKRPIHARGHTASEPPIRAESYRRDNERAAKIIGTSLIDVAGWFLRFAQTDLNELRAGQWTDLQYEVAALGEVQHLGPDPNIFWNQAIAWKDWRGHKRLGEALMLEPPTSLPPQRAIKALQAEVLKALTDLTDGPGTTTLTLSPAAVLILPVQHGDRSLALCAVQQPADLFRYTFTVTLCWVAHRVRRCRECQRVFYADRKNKEYCGVACQNRAGTKRWRQAGGKRRRKK